MPAALVVSAAGVALRSNGAILRAANASKEPPMKTLTLKLSGTAAGVLGLDVPDEMYPRGYIRVVEWRKHGRGSLVVVEADPTITGLILYDLDDRGWNRSGFDSTSDACKEAFKLNVKRVADQLRLDSADLGTQYRNVVRALRALEQQS